MARSRSLIVIVTGIVWLQAPLLTVTCPVYVPGESPLGSAETVSVEGIPGRATAAAGCTDSQFPPVVVDAAAMKFSVPPPALDTVTVWLRALPARGNGKERLSLSTPRTGPTPPATAKVMGIAM